MVESNLYIISPIVISGLALIVSILGYLNSNKGLKISEQEHKISEEEHKLTKEKEDQKKNLTSLLKLLNATSKTLETLPDDITFGNMDYLNTDIMQEVYENKKLNLLIKLRYLNVNNKKVSLESVYDERFLKSEIEVYLDYSKHSHMSYSSDLYYETSPQLPYSETFDISMILYTLGELRQNLDDLKEFELFIGSFDSGLLDSIENEYSEVLKLIYKTLSEKNFSFEFTSDMKPSDIEKILRDSLNLTKIKNKSEFMATFLKNIVDNISKELSMRILTQ